MPSTFLPTLRRRVARAPTSPGVYRWMNKDGEVLYVGKAKNLRNRLRNYVLETIPKGIGPWKQSFLQQIADFDVTIVNSELEALVLETNLIKQLRPKYNVAMKDDKNYVYLQVTTKDPYPRVELLRKIENKNALSFGPFLSTYEINQALNMLHEIFCFRACKQSLDALNRAVGDRDAVYDSGTLRGCLDYQIGQCCGLCAGVISQEEYKSRIAQVMHFLKGDYKPVLEKGKELMLQAAKDKKFERAARLRDNLTVIESLQERQLVSDTSGENVDVIGLALLSGKVQVMVMHKREGKLIGEEQFALMGRAESIAEVLDQFLPQYYENVLDIPEIVLVGEDFEERKTVEEFLTIRNATHLRQGYGGRGKKVSIKVPERGRKSQLLELAEKNAQEKAKQIEASWEADQRNTENALDELARVLDLASAPERIEGYDISHTGGTETVGSMVVFCKGKPRNDHYRSFTIHTMRDGVVDDYRALKEVLTRRLRHAAGGIKIEEEKWEEEGVTFGKARKEELDAIRALLLEHPGDLSVDGVDYKDFIVARRESEVIAMARIFEHEKGLRELKSVCVVEEERGSRLGQFLVRHILRNEKKKVYITTDPRLEQYYAAVGFRYVIKPPPLLQQHIEHSKEDHPTPDIAMVYDPVQHKTDISLGAMPDLLVIDGGKGQLGVAVEVLKNLNLTIPVIGLAKREEEVFVPEKSEPVIFQNDSPAKFLLMRLRDEAHRFANRHRSKRATKHAMQSKLDVIAGIGPDTRQKLLLKFGSADGVRRATDEELREVLTEEQIQALHRSL